MKKIVQIIFAISSMVLVFTSCDIDMAYLVSTGTLRIAGEYENTRANMLYAATMIQHTASTAGYFSGDKYFYNAQYSGAYMERHFTDVIRLFSQAIEKTKGDANLVNINSTAVILRAFDLHRMTDLYGDIPWSNSYKIIPRLQISIAEVYFLESNISGAM